MPQQQSSKLTGFLEASKSKGMPDEVLTRLLIHRGWPEDEVLTALEGYWERVTGVPFPERAGRGESSRDAFLYLLSFATLATWASALGSMLFRFIEHWFPDPVVSLQGYSPRSAVTWQMASIAVAFPVFLLVMRTILREAQHQPERLQSSVRRWLTYIALLLTAGGLIGDLICFVDYFLTGELTARFLLKALTVLLICAGIFAYYLGSLRWDKEEDLAWARGRSLWFGGGSTAAVIAAFCIGLGFAGTPSAQRHLEADQRRVQDLRAIAIAMHARFRRLDAASPGKTALPSSLNELAAYGISGSQTKDPESRTPYGYRPQTPAGAYEICAAFSQASEQDPMHRTEFWYHGKGSTCFTLDAALQPPW